MKYWLRYSKTDLMRFVGHLDTLHHFERILRRANLPLAFSQGFSPHPLLSVAAPLPVGQSSLAEYLELELTEEMVPADLVKAIEPVLPQGIGLLGAAAVPAGIKALMSQVRFAEYRIAGTTEDLARQAQALLDRQSCLLTVKRKSGLKEVDIRPFVRALAVDCDGHLLACLATGSRGNLRPEDLWRAVAGGGRPDSILRLELYLGSEDRPVTPWQLLGLCGQ